LFIVLNGAPTAISFVLPAWPDTARWQRVLATVDESAAPATANAGDKRTAPPGSVTVFAGQK
jgi:hypothetical protein